MFDNAFLPFLRKNKIKLNRLELPFILVALLLLTTIPTIISYQKGKALYLTMSIRSSATGEATLYYDLGGGFREKDKAITQIRKDPAALVYGFAIPNQDLLRFRFDPPATFEGIISIGDIRIVNTQGKTLREIDANLLKPLHKLRTFQHAGSDVIFTVQDGADDPQVGINLDSPFRPTWSILKDGLFLGLIAGEFVLLILIYFLISYLCPRWLAHPKRRLILIAFLFLYAGGFWVLFGKAKTTYLKIIMQSSSSGVAQLYFDTGSGYSEALSVRVSISGGTDFSDHLFLLPNKEIFQFRFDPLSSVGRFVIRQIEVVNGLGVSIHSLALSQVQPEYQIREHTLLDQDLRIVTEEPADDPQLIVNLRQPLHVSKIDLLLNPVFLVCSLLLFPIVLLSMAGIAWGWRKSMAGIAWGRQCMKIYQRFVERKMNITQPIEEGFVIGKGTILTLIVVFVLLHLLCFFASYPLTAGPFWHDFSSFLLVAHHPLHGMGAPYTDYWDIKPPGLSILLMTWLYLLGDNGWWIGILALCLGAITYASVILILFSLRIQPFLTCLLALIAIPLLRVNDTEMFLNSEFIGSAVSVCGLALVVWAFSQRNVRFLWISFLAGFLLVFAGQVKDPYVPAVITICSLLIARQGVKKMLFASGGALLGGAVVLAWLWSWDALGAYVDVLQFKKAAFSINVTPTFLWGACERSFASLSHEVYKLKSVVLGTGLCMVSVLWIIYRRRLRPLLAVWCWVIANFAGYVLQQRSGGHYNVQLVAPTVLMLLGLGFVVYDFTSIIADRFRNQPIHYLLKIIVPCVLAIALVLTQQNDIQKVWRHLSFKRITNPWWESSQRGSTEFEPIKTILDKKLNRDDRIMVVYGWDTATYYLYLQRQPATRYFIVNPLIMGPKEKNEFRIQFLSRLPKAIIYKLGGADMDVDAFEKDVVPIRKILNTHYEMIWGSGKSKSPVLFLLKGNSGSI